MRPCLHHDWEESARPGGLLGGVYRVAWGGGACLGHGVVALTALPAAGGGGALEELLRGVVTG